MLGFKLQRFLGYIRKGIGIAEIFLEDKYENQDHLKQGKKRGEGIIQSLRIEGINFGKMYVKSGRRAHTIEY